MCGQDETTHTHGVLEDIKNYAQKIKTWLRGLWNGNKQIQQQAYV
jgi:hypothetical protein